jgi:hypothetical protein
MEKSVRFPVRFSDGINYFASEAYVPDTLTLSAGFYPSSIPVEQIDDFFALVDEEFFCNAIGTEKNVSYGSPMDEN